MSHSRGAVPHPHCHPTEQRVLEDRQRVRVVRADRYHGSRQCATPLRDAGCTGYTVINAGYTGYVMRWLVVPEDPWGGRGETVPSQLMKW